MIESDLISSFESGRRAWSNSAAVPRGALCGDASLRALWADAVSSMRSDVHSYCRPFAERLRAAASILSECNCRSVAAVYRDIALCCEFSDGITCAFRLLSLRPNLYLHIEYQSATVNALRNLGTMEIDSVSYPIIAPRPLWSRILFPRRGSTQACQLLAFDRELKAFFAQVGARVGFLEGAATGHDRVKEQQGS
jgi:hypothetical protein